VCPGTLALRSTRCGRSLGVFVVVVLFAVVVVFRRIVCDGGGGGGVITSRFGCLLRDVAFGAVVCGWRCRCVVVVWRWWW